MARKKRPRATQRSATLSGGAARFILAGLTALAVVAALAAVTFVIAGRGEDGPATASDDGVKKAVIVDQLQLTQPNPDFTSRARELLGADGYAVDYIEGDAVTVDFYRTLPSRGYDLVLLRVHAGITTEVDAETGEKSGKEYVSLFTGEPYDESKYPDEQMNRLGKARYENGEGDPLFGIGPEFVSRSMDGDFGGATIVMMGCDGLRSQTTAQAFLDRGADSFVSWSKPVSAPHTDEATETLLENLLEKDMDLEAAVEETAAEVGPDPTYDGELRVLTG
jgi:hypothetical protein